MYIVEKNTYKLDGGSVCLEVSAEDSTPPLKFVCGEGTPHPNFLHCPSKHPTFRLPVGMISNGPPVGEGKEECPFPGDCFGDFFFNA